MTDLFGHFGHAGHFNHLGHSGHVTFDTVHHSDTQSAISHGIHHVDLRTGCLNGSHIEPFDGVHHSYTQSAIVAKPNLHLVGSDPRTWEPMANRTVMPHVDKSAMVHDVPHVDLRSGCSATITHVDKSAMVHGAPHPPHSFPPQMKSVSLSVHGSSHPTPLASSFNGFHASGGSHHGFNGGGCVDIGRTQVCVDGHVGGGWQGAVDVHRSTTLGHGVDVGVGAHHEHHDSTVTVDGSFRF